MHIQYATIQYYIYVLIIHYDLLAHDRIMWRILVI